MDEIRLGPFALDAIYLGDAVNLLEELPDGCINLIVTDPPFAIDFRSQRMNYNRTGAHVIDGYREIPWQEYGKFTHRWMNQAARVLAPDGSLYVFSGWNRLIDVLSGLEEAGLTTINHIIWKYQFGVFTQRKYVTSHYHILYAVKDPRRYCFNKIEHYPEDVWVINREYWKGKVKTPTKLPSALIRKILGFSSCPGDIILDPFVGSGTVAVVCKEMDRHFLGFELVDEYCAFAKARLSETRLKR